jgi:hypothetical protein
MRIKVTSVDHNPPELDAQLPFTFRTVRALPGPKRDEHFLGKLDRPLIWAKAGEQVAVDHLVVWARWQDTRIQPGMIGLPIGIAYVVDPSQIGDARFDLGKCEYVAIGTARDTKWPLFLMASPIRGIWRWLKGARPPPSS